MSDTTYNGWSNRATWAADLHLSNDEGTYTWACESAAEAVDRAAGDLERGLTHDERNEAIRALANEIEHFFREGYDLLFNPAPGDDPIGPNDLKFHRLALQDIGHPDYVNWREVADDWVDAAIEERD